MLAKWLIQRFIQANLLLPQWKDQWTSNGVCTGLCLQVANMVFDGTFKPSTFAADLALRFERAVKKHRIYKMESRLMVASNEGLTFANVIDGLRQHFAVVAAAVDKGLGLGDLAQAMGLLGVGVYSLALGFQKGGGHTLLLIRSNAALFVFDPAIGLMLIKDPTVSSIAQFLVAYRSDVLRTGNRELSGWDVASWRRETSGDINC